MKCPSCNSHVSLWKMRGKRPCPSCGALLKNGFTRSGYVTFAFFLALAGGIDYFGSTELILPLCRGSDACSFGWGAASATVYLLAVYASAAVGALQYSLVSGSRGVNS